MPRVAAYGGPQVGPVAPSNDRLRAANAGDGGVGESVARFGQQLGQYADDQAKTRAQDLMLQADQQMKAATIGFKDLRGRDAADGLKGIGEALDATRDNTLAAAKDPLVRSYLKASLERYHGLYAEDINAHATEQERVYAKAQGAAWATNYAENAVLNRDKPDVSADFVNKMGMQIEDNLRAQGLGDPAIIASEKRKAVSGVHASNVDAYLADGDLDTAAAYFGAHKDSMVASDEISLSGRLRGPLEKRETAGDAGAVMGANWSAATGAGVNYADPLRGLGHGVSDAYGVARGSGKTHNGVDFPAPKGTPIHSIGAGTIKSVGHDDKSGNFVIVDHGDGTTSSYAHMAAKAGFKPGDLVTPDTVLGDVGTTGHTSGPHLHLVVRKDGATVDPQGVIGAAQQGAQRHDLDSLLARADLMADKAGWSPERRDRAKDEIKRRVSTDDTLQRRQEDDADRAAQEFILSKREAFTDASQIPRGTWDKMSVTQRSSAITIAKANSQPKEAKPNSLAIMQAHATMYAEPERFKALDLSQYVGKVAPAELDELVSAQAKMRVEKPGEDHSPRSAIAGAISFQTKLDPDLDKALDPKTNPQAYANVATDMEGYLRAVTGGKRPPTDAELDAAWNRATMKVVVKGGSFFGRDVEKPRFGVKPGEIYQVDIPDDVRARIAGSYQRTFGKAADENDITQIYVVNKGKAGFW